MFDPSLGGAQVHDFNPGIAQSGLFWTTPVPSDAVETDIPAGTATFELQNAHMPDFISFDNAINGTGSLPRPGVVSFRVTWTATGPSAVTDIASKRFHGEHAPAVAQMEWSGRAGDFDFASRPIETSSSPNGALLGVQRTGSFY